jgi:hypothetical protein
MDGESGGEMEVDCEYEDGSEMEVGSESEIDGDSDSEDEDEIKIDNGSESKINGQDPNPATVEDSDAVRMLYFILPASWLNYSLQAALKRSQPLEEQSRLCKRPEDFLPTNEDNLFRDGQLVGTPHLTLMLGSNSLNSSLEPCNRC